MGTTARLLIAFQQYPSIGFSLVTTITYAFVNRNGLTTLPHTTEILGYRQLTEALADDIFGIRNSPRHTIQLLSLIS
jgi:hypothetical protein